MKVIITFKTPDATHHAIERALEYNEELEAIEDEEERSWKKEELEASLDEALSKWIRYSEYIDIEIDTEAGTATVLPVGG